MEDNNHDSIEITTSVIRSMTGFISVVSSITVALMILRSSPKLSTVLHRLIFGLSISDILCSICMVFSSLPLPKGTSKMALGNSSTCNVQGFFLFFYGILSPWYNAALAVFFLLKVKYNLSDATFSSKIEPFFHIFPTSLALASCIYSLKKTYYNPFEGLCDLNDYPNFCSEDPEVECERGEGVLKDWVIVGNLILDYMFVPLLIITSMTHSYWVVYRQEQRVETYRRESLNIAEVDASTSNAGDVDIDSFGRISRNVKNMLNRGFAYALAWFLSFSPPLIVGIMRMFAQSDTSASPWLAIIVVIFQPLQGFFNFVVFIYPKVVQIRLFDPECGLFEAVISAVKFHPGETSLLAPQSTRRRSVTRVERTRIPNMPPEQRNFKSLSKILKNGTSSTAMNIRSEENLEGEESKHEPPVEKLDNNPAGVRFFPSLSFEERNNDESSLDNIV